MANANELMALGIPAALAKKIVARFVAKNEDSTVASGQTLTVAGTLDVTGNTKIGSAAADTVGFHGATPVTQQTVTAVATGATAATIVTSLQALQSALNSLGLVKNA